MKDMLKQLMYTALVLLLIFAPAIITLNYWSKKSIEEAYQSGVEANVDGIPVEANPYCNAFNSQESKAWYDGWCDMNKVSHD